MFQCLFLFSSRFDALVVKTRPIDIAWPANAKEIAREILDYVTDGDTRPLLVHAFSVSSHVYAEMLDLMDASEGEEARVCGAE